MSTTEEFSPAIMKLAGGLADEPTGDPQAPATVEDTGVEPSILRDLALKLANTTPRLTTEWAAEQMRLPISVIERIFWQLRDDQLLEILGQSGPMTYRYAITQR